MKYFLSVLSILLYSIGMQGQVITPGGSTSFCAGGNVVLSVTQTSGITGYQWINGSTNVGSDIDNFTAIASGSYTVRLTRVSSTDTTIGPIVVTAKPLPQVTVASADICIGQSTTLTASGANTYTWSPATGLSATTGPTVTANPSVTTPYTVTGVGLNGCSKTAVSTVSVNAYPVANFTFTPSGQCSNVPVQFTNTSSGGATYSWDFGDINAGSANTSTAPNPVHTFIGTTGNGSQSFTIIQTVKTAAGCADTKPLNITTTQVADGTLGGTGKVTYNGQVYFTTCGLTSGDFTFTNQSSTSGTNTSYKIVWGDGSPDFDAVTFLTTTHTYSIGSHSILFIIAGNNGCIDTTEYFAFVGTNPAVGLNNPGNTLACSGESLTFPITGVATNAPGTVYTVTFNDGTPPINYIHPDIPASMTHVFNTTSCGTISSNGTNLYANSFSANIVATNPCNSSAATVVPIYISKKPKAAFTISPKDKVCINTIVTFTNTSANNFVSNGSCINGNSIWTVTPATGWSITSGNLGNDFGLTDPSVWLDGSTNLSLNFNSPGAYTVKIKTGNSNCGVDETSQTICVATPPTPSFTLDNTTGCVPFNITATNTTTSLNSCSAPTYLWTVSYTPAFCGFSASWDFAPGSSNTSTNPTFIFNNPGTYTILLEVTNECGTYPVSHKVDITKPPTVNITPPIYPCGPITVTPAATVTSCGIKPLTYLWTFAGGVPATSTAANPGPVSFSAVGPHDITLAVTNECATITDKVTVTVTAAPDVVVPADKIYCGGATTGQLNFSSTVGTPLYNWTNNNTAIGIPASGTGNIASFLATNNGSTPLTATITVTPFVSAACSGIPVSFTITVNPRPAAPLVVSPIIYCLNATAVPLSATAGAGNILNWYSNISLTNGTTTAPTPSTAIAGPVVYYVTQTNNFACESAPAIINIQVNATITGNTIASDNTICANTIPAAIVTLNSVSGGSGGYNYIWQSSTDGGVTWADIPGATNESFAPPALSVTTEYRRIITSATCSDISNIVTITVLGALTNFDIAGAQTICEGLTPALLTGGLPTGGGGSYTYAWESSTDNINWTANGTSGQDYQPGSLLKTTYFRRKVFASQCNAISPAVTVTINPTPRATINPTSLIMCEYDPASVLFSATAGTAPFNIELTITAPGGSTSTLTQTINSNTGTISVIAANSPPGLYTIALTKITDSKNCLNTGAISSVTITVNPTPSLTLSAPPTICNGNNTVLSVSGASSYGWSPATGLSSATGNSVAASPASTITYTVAGTLNGCVASSTILVTVIPGATIANAGADQILCNTNTATLSANAPAIGTGSWSQLSGPSAIITDPSLTNTTVTGLTGGQRYIFQWTITGFPPCPATNSIVTVDVLSPITNTIKNDTIICSGQGVLLQTQNLSGGNSNILNAQYTYQWEFASPAQSNWQPVPGATQENLNVNPTTSTCYSRKVKSNNSCETISNPVCITVNPSIGNNTISANQQLCVNITPANLIGAIPNGGDDNYIYRWQTSADNINWTDIGSNINFQPPVYTVAGVHYFRRNVTSGNCTSVSNAITITVRPDSKAIFTANSSIACSPFNLAKAISVTALPDSNGLYQWYANGNLFGSNATGIFPGYTIVNPADTVIIRLKTSSQYGCKSDSIEKQFVTIITAVAKFTKNTIVGCGPLPVAFTNISSQLNVNGVQFFWNFGNGITSTLIQPGTVIFNASPFFTDTTYKVLLKAYNGCDTTFWLDSVKVSANPKARFGVDTTSGCSPFTVKISNTSPAGSNVFYWDFGNGDKDTTYTNSVFNYIYHVGNNVDTFTLRLIAENQCRRDTQTLDIRVAPNLIRPLINVNGSQLFGCAPHTVTFNNNTFGATAFTWNFGDNSLPVITNNNQSTVPHTYDKAGVFTVAIDITNGCSDTTVFTQVTVYAKPVAAFTSSSAVYCLDDTVRVTNNSLNATNYQWYWGDLNSSPGVQPAHVYAVPGNYTIRLQAEKTDNSGLVCYDTIVRSVTILSKPAVSVQSNIQSINCAPFTLAVFAPAIISEKVTWYFYDSTINPSIITATGINAQYTFGKPGTFYVKMVAVNAAGCKDSTTITFTVRGKAVASFSPSNLAVCTRDTTVAYINTTTYNGTDPISYKWMVDNVLLSTNGNFTHRYAVSQVALLPQIFNTSLIVTNTVGCSDTANATLQMNPVVKAKFSFINPTDCVPFKPIINNTSTYTTSYKWLLNGNTVSTVAAPDFAITKSSTVYTITLIADNVYGCKPDTMAFTFTSRVRPAAAFTVSDTLGCTGVLNLATNNTTTNASTYIWNWGDTSGNSTFHHPTHLYVKEGQYLITLVASDGVCTDTTEQLVKVSTKPTVNFSVDQTITCDTARVQFTNLSINGNNYNWTFGDGTLSAETNPSHSFAPNVAPYTVKLVGSSRFGCKDSAVKANLVLAKVPPASNFFISPSPVITLPNYTFNFNNLTLNSINYKYLWSLGDGTFANTRDVTRKYADTGNYTIRLIVLDTATNCPDTTIKIARVDGFPGYLYVPNAICPACIQSNLRTFLPKAVGLKEYRLQIYTTWNELVFDTRAIDSKGTPTEAWDGTWQKRPGKSLVQQDVYVWRIDAKFLNGSEWLGMIYPGESKYKKAGTITVVK